MIKKQIAIYILILFGSQYSYGQFDRVLNGFTEMEKLEKEKKHLLDSLKKDFKSKLNELKRTYEIEYANSSNELMEELEDTFKTEKKKMQKSLKLNRKDLKKSAFDQRRKLQKTPREEVVPLELEEVTPVKFEKPIALINEAEEHLGTPYKYGGTNRKGFDCSGFVKFVYEKQGIDLPRVSKDQANAGKNVPISKAEPGDLLFFSHGGGKIDHVGIVLKNQGNSLEMIHASSSKGVIKTEVNSSSYWKKRLKKARRVN